MKTIPCTHCEGTGQVYDVTYTVDGVSKDPSGAFSNPRRAFCGTCMGSGHLQEDDTRPGAIEADIRRQGEEE